MNAVTVVPAEGSLKVIEGTVTYPTGTRLRAVLVSEEEYQRWEEIPAESRYDMLIQSTSASFRQWMDEDEDWEIPVSAPKG